MNTAATMKLTADGRVAPNLPSGPDKAAGPAHSPTGIALWLFIGVATSLFSLFLASYVMRMDSSDWSPVVMPWQLWLSTTLLIAGSIVLQLAVAAARAGQAQRARALLLAGGACACAFLGAQLWGWQAMLSMRVMPSGNPAASFFYLLTAMHGLHVIGGLVGWVAVVRRMPRMPRTPCMHAAGQAEQGLRMLDVRPIALCARYWHFLLAVWAVLFATLGWLTPELVRIICGTS